jgi:hypothetical protein
MISSFKRLSIATQSLIFLALTLAATSSALYFWARDNALASELSHTRTVADMADAFRAQAAKHGGFYVRRETKEDVAKVGKYLASFEAESKSADGEVKNYEFHQKNPFLALGDFSAEVAKSKAAAKFKMISDNYMNPTNKPDSFEKSALEKLRQEGATDEFWLVEGGQLRYARSLRATKACLSCHGDFDNAPKAVKANYPKPMTGAGGGYGYLDGTVVGITSVKVAHKSTLEMLKAQNAGFWVSALSVLGLMLTAYFVVLSGIVRPLRIQSKYAENIAVSEDILKVKIPSFDDNESTSSNEIHLQAHALKALHQSMATATAYIQKIRK